MTALQTAVNSLVRTLVSTADADRVRRTGTRTFDRPASIGVRTENGSLSITGTDREDVLLRYTKRGPSEDALDRVSIETAVTADDERRIGVSQPKGESVSVDLELAVPRSLAVAEARTKNGSIELRGTAGEPDIETVNGSIDVADHDGYVDVRSENGAIELRETGVDRAETGNGRLSIDLDAIRGPTEIRAQVGEIDVALGSIDADVALETNIGSIEAPVLEKRSAGFGQTVVEGTVGDGGERLDISASVGSIRLDR
ncbi:DUF4097 family beta strand repeat-containing protein [Halovivax gelatinilyticus]|uniref:DUF4097 family beta strand repeat-containing protein n=1 Tax=Halovivax gelatinilyticus TaxID=2961597 RepID=UPI0020CA2CFD|nr:DUF4097 family beta strand repeat-containing protein [Halovivax gelatinilyticus]